MSSFWAFPSCGSCPPISMAMTLHPKWKCIVPIFKKQNYDLNPSRWKGLESPTLHPLTKPACETCCLATKSSLTMKSNYFGLALICLFSEISDPIVFNGWEIHMTSRFIEYSNSCEDVSKVFFSSSFMMLREGADREKRLLIPYLPTAVPTPLLSSLCFWIFFFVNWEVLSRVINCFRWKVLLKAIQIPYDFPKALCIRIHKWEQCEFVTILLFANNQYILMLRDSIRIRHVELCHPVIYHMNLRELLLKGLTNLERDK